MHSHHAVDLQVIYSADPSVQLSVTPGMYPHGHVGEGKPDDNSRSVVGITNGLGHGMPHDPSLSHHPRAHLSWGCCSPYVCFDAVWSTLQPIRNRERRAFPLTGRCCPPCWPARWHIPSL